ncbi:MAG: LacI family DNA-binding transcriptional regulator [Thermomicrobiales bacterium]
MATMSDIAKLAGVSVTTVSHVLNNSRPVREETSDRVKSAALDLGYRPNGLARSLRRKETLTIGLVVPDIANPFFAEIGRGLEVASFNAGYHVIFCNSGGDAEQESRHIVALLEKRVDGIVIAPAAIEPEPLVAMIGGDIPVVMIDRDIPGLGCDVVMADNASGGRQAVDHLVALGHRRIGCVVSRAASRSTEPGRFHGYRQGMRAAELDDTSLVVVTDELENATPESEVDAGYIATSQFLQSNPRPTALFLTNDLMAIGALRAAHDNGITVPDELSIVGFDDILLARYAIPSLTTVIQPRSAMGTFAAELLIARSRDRASEWRRNTLDVSLVARESTGPCRVHA